jgi:hypothetical protein
VLDRVTAQRRCAHTCAPARNACKGY